MINMQYRMCPAISSYPSKAFYKSMLVDAPSVLTRPLPWALQTLKPLFAPYAFINLLSSQENAANEKSRSNLSEAR
jgi:superfamily I DNA and/or RNA helicase